jgi:RNA polymerase sigma-70 factor (ECF subfamily)
MFAMPFEEIAEVVGRSPAAARQLASRARRRVQGATPTLDTDLRVQRRVVDAFLAASRNGDFEGLLALLDPDVVFRIDGGRVARMTLAPIHGAEAVARTVLERGAPFARLGRPARVNDGAGVIVESHGKPIAVGALSIAGGKIVAIDIVTDPEKLQALQRG